MGSWRTYPRSVLGTAGSNACGALGGRYEDTASFAASPVSSRPAVPMLFAYGRIPSGLTGVGMRRYERNREENRGRMQGPPLHLTRGLAHVIATVLEPRSDDAPSNEQFDALLTRFPHFGEGFGLNYGVGW